MSKRTRIGLAAIVAVAATVLVEASASAAPDDREQCKASAEQGQQLHDEGKYRRAREQMLICAREVCPGFIRSDCGKWLVDLDREAPTIVLGARDPKGVDLVDVRVSMDGVSIQERLDGKPMMTDSGEHTFRFEAKDGSVKEERVLIRAAEKARPIIASFSAPTPPPTVAVPATPVSTTPPPEPGPHARGSMVPALIVGGIGVVALGSFAFFGLTGMSDVDDLEKCRGKCAPADVDSARTKLHIADASLAVGIISLGVATVLYLTRSKVETKVQASSFRFDAGPLAGGGGVTSIGGRF